MTASEDYYEVFARHDRAQPIRHIGTVTATTEEDAEVFATTLYEEWKWIDMFIVPRRELVTVVRPD